jgi:hypothetical protein
LTLLSGDGNQDYIIGTPNTLTGIIIEPIVVIEDPPLVNITLEPSTINEDGTTSLVYTFTRNGSAATPLTVNYSVGGTAAFSIDYTQAGTNNFTSSNGSIDFAANVNTATLTITPIADTAIEPDETVVLTLLDGTNNEVPYRISALNIASGTIIEPIIVPAPIININLEPASVNEGGQQTLNYFFTRTGSTSQPLTVNYSVGGSASFGTDYNQTGATNFNNTSGTINFAADSTRADLVISTTTDSLLEQNETILLNLISDSNYTIGTNSNATGTIVDQSPVIPELSFDVTPGRVAEDGVESLVYTFTRTGSTAESLTATFNVGGDAVFGTDYIVTGVNSSLRSISSSSGTFDFAAGSNTATVVIDPTSDSITEQDENVTLTLVASRNYTVNTPGSVTGIITDATVTPTVNVTLTPDSINEGSSQNLTYLFTRTGATTQPLTVNYNLGGSATLAIDYNQTGGVANIDLNTGSITFAANSAEAALVINSIADANPEQNETVDLTLIADFGDNLNYIIGTSNTLTGTIIEPIVTIEDPPLVSITLEPSTINEDGTTSLVYTFTRSGSATTLLTVNYSVGGTAAFGNDYTQAGTNNFTSSNGSIDFAANVNTATLTITPIADTTIESNETVILTLLDGISNAVPYRINSLNTASGTIIEPILIPAPVININLEPASVNEGGQQTLNYFFTRTGSTSQPLTVNYSVGGSASFGADYNQTGAASFNNTSGTITFAADSAQADLVITTITDTLSEQNETISLNLIANSNYVVGVNSSALGTIIDPPPIIPGVSLAVTPSRVAEDGAENLVYTFTRTGSTTESLTATFNVGGNATLGNDYILTGANSLNSVSSSGTATLNVGTVNFAAGSNTATVIVDPTSDLITEQDENVTLTLVTNRSYTINTPGAITSTIADAIIVPTINVTLAPNSINEGSAQNLTYLFTRTGSTTQPLIVNYNLGGSATLAIDYNQTGGSTNVDPNTGNVTSRITFAANSAEATLVINSIADANPEQNETVDLTLLSGSGYGNQNYIVGTSNTLTGTIIEPIITVTNRPPTALVFNNRFLIAENTNTTNPIRLTDIAITDDQLGINTLSLSGVDASSFQLIGTSLFLRSGVALDFETKTTYDLIVTVDDITVGTTPDVTSSFTLIVTDINEPPTGAPIILIGNTFQNTPIRIPRSTFLTGFTDVENDPLNVVNPTANNGTIINNNDGTFTLIPTPDFSGQIDITYGVTDGVNILTGQRRSVVALPPANGLNFIGTSNLDVGAINNLTSGIFAANPNNVNLVGDEINLLGGVDSVTIPGRIITLQPDSRNQVIQIGSADSNSLNILDLTPTDLAAISNGFSRIIFGRASGTGNININSNLTFRDPILLQSPGGQISITAAITLIDDATLDFNVQTLVKSGNSTLTIDGNTATTFIGNTTIDGGVLVLAKSPNTEALRNAPILINGGVLQLGNNEQINNAADLTLNGGSFNLNGFNETLDQLQLVSNSTINFGNGNSKLTFANSITQRWTGLLSIENWSSTSGETIRFGNSAAALTASQLSNIQFVGFNRGANIDANGFITPIGTPVSISVPDNDGVSDDIENLAANGGDGNLDGIRDSLQENVVSILNLGGTDVNSIATVIAKAGAKISGLRLRTNPITTATITSLANPIEFKITGLANGAATTVEYIIAKDDQNRRYNTYLLFGATADNITPHAYEFLYDGRTGAELFDTSGDGFVDKAVIHFIDGQRGDSDLTVNGEIQDPGAPGVASTPVTLNLDANNVVQLTGTAGIAIANFSVVANQTKQVSEVGFFKINGTNLVNGIAANAAGFAQAALQSGQVIFSSLADNLLSTADISRQLQLNAGDRLGFYLVQNGTVDTALQRNDFSNVLFSIDQANPTGRRALEVTIETNGSYRLQWEQGSATVADDLILNLQLQSTPLNNQNLVASIQGDRESELLDLSSFVGQDVQVNFTLQREAAFNDTVGFYQIEDAQGTVTSITGAKIKPGEVGYQAAVIQNRIVGVDLAVANGQTALIDAVLRGGAIYAPFLIANGNPNNLNGNFSNVYTLYTVGNADVTDHVRLLGDNTFGFEDLVGAGDRDFNDVVLKAIFKNS